MSGAIPNLKKTISFECSLEKVKNGIERISNMSEKFKKNNSVINKYIFKSTDTSILGVFVDINLSSISDTKTEINIEVRKKIGFFDQANEMQKVNDLISKLFEAIVKGKNLNESAEMFGKGKIKIRKHKRKIKIWLLIMGIFYHISNLQIIYSRACKFACLVEKLKLRKEYIRGLFIKKSDSGIIFNITETLGYKIAERLNMYFALLTRLGYSYPIKSIKCNWKNDINNNDGIIFISVHLPLIKVALAKLLTEGQKIDAAISANSTLDGQMPFWGIPKKVPIILNGAMSLIKVKSILKDKGCVVMMADSGPTSKIYPNIFHLAAKMNASVFFVLAYLNEESIVEINMYEAPYCQSTSGQQIEKNITALREARDEILLKYAKQYSRR